MHSSRSKHPYWIILPAAVVGLAVLTIGGCPSSTSAPTGGGGDETSSGDTTGGTATAEVMSTVQERMTIAQFEAVVDQDDDLADIVDRVKRSLPVGDYLAAGKYGAPNGVELVWAALENSGDEPIIVLRHCNNGDCISVFEEYVGGREDVEWVAMEGVVPIRSIPTPYLLFLIDESDPDGTAQLAPVDPKFQGAARRQSPAASATAPRPVTTADKNRQTRATTGPKFRVATAFGRAFSCESYSWWEIVDDMKQHGYTDTDATYHTDATTLDTLLRTSGPDDALVIYAHGGRSESSGKVVSITVAEHRYDTKHYSLQRIKDTLALNPSGGPGVLFLANCQSGDLVAELADPEHPDRVVLGLSHEDATSSAFRAVKVFFEHYTGGATVQEAINAVNDSGVFFGPNTRLVANPGANLDQRFTGAGTTSTGGDSDTGDGTSGAGISGCPNAAYEYTGFANVDGRGPNDGVDPQICLSGSFGTPTITWDTAALPGVYKILLYNDLSTRLYWAIESGSSSGPITPPVTYGRAPAGTKELTPAPGDLDDYSGEYRLVVYGTSGPALVSFDVVSGEPRFEIISYHNSDGSYCMNADPNCVYDFESVGQVKLSGDPRYPTIGWAGVGYPVVEVSVLRWDFRTGESDMDWVYCIGVEDYSDKTQQLSSPVTYGDYGVAGATTARNCTPVMPAPALEAHAQVWYDISIKYRVLDDDENATFPGERPAVTFILIDK